MMKKKWYILFILVFAINAPIFYLFDDNRICIPDIGSRCSNFFFLRVFVQSAVLTAFFWFSLRQREKENTKE